MEIHHISAIQIRCSVYLKNRLVICYLMMYNK